MAPAPAGGYTIAPLTGHYGHGHGQCVLDEHFQPVHHTGRRYLVRLLERLAPAANIDPAAYSVELIADRRGLEEVNAMTCAGSRMIWLSVKAYTELVGHEVSLAYVIAHELAHGGVGEDLIVRGISWMTPADRALYQRLTPRQYAEVVFDLQSAELLLRAGFLPDAIVDGAGFILGRDGAAHLLPAMDSHPAGWDRIQLLTSYLSSRYAGGRDLATVGRVIPRPGRVLSKR